MYNKDGAFGKVRLAAQEPPQNKELFYVGLCGWHSCNDQYCIHRKEHAGALFLYTVGGQGEMNIEGRDFQLPTGSVAFIPQDASGWYRTPKGGHWEFYWLHPRGERALKFVEMLGRQGLCRPTATVERYARLVEELLALCPKRSARSDVEISMTMSRLLHQSVLDLSAPAEPQTLAEKAMNYLSLHMSEQISLPQVAENLFISPAHLGRVFKAEWGMTPHQYLTGCRLRAADKLLSAGTLTVSQIAELTGFCSPSHFVNTYKKYYGTTPARRFRHTE